jgi:hypothetical protein
MLPKLLLPPDSNNYKGKPGNEVNETEVQGGMARRRRAEVGATWKVNVQWTCGQAHYDYLLAFYRTAIAHGSKPFLIDLVLGAGAVTEYTAAVVAGSWDAPVSQSGLTYVVQAILEVVPLIDDATADAAIIAAFAL